MSEAVGYRVALPDGRLSDEIVVSANRQPSRIHRFCVLVVDQESGRCYTIHRSRLVPLAAAPPPPSPEPKRRKSVCFECGRVEGIVYDEVQCPYRGGAPCGLIKAHAGTPS